MNTLNLALRTANSLMSWSQEGEEYLQPDALEYRSKLGARRSSNVSITARRGAAAVSATQKEEEYIQFDALGVREQTGRRAQQQCC